MWFFVPAENDNAQPWIGQIKVSRNPRESGSFELIRHVEATQIYDHPFDTKDAIVGLLDHQRPSTLLRPIVTKIDPGSMGSFSRTRIEGIFQSFLSGLAIDDPTQERFLGLSFSSAAFRSWYGGGSHRVEHGSEQTTITVPKADSKTVTVEGLGKLTCAAWSKLASGIGTAEVQSDAVFSMTFRDTKSLDQIHEYCFAFDSLFGFLVGYPGPPPKFNIWLAQEQDIGEGRKIHPSGDLEIFGQDWIEARPPVLDECLHRNGEGGADASSILKAFLPDMGDMLARFHAVQYCRYHSSNISDKFAVVMPVLEAHIRAKYETKDETTYRQLQKDFFAWLDANASPEFKEFYSKHLQVKDSKAPSLPTLLGRAIDAINAKGFILPKDYRKRLNDRRAKLFHTIPQTLEADDARRFYDETRAATAILLLSTLEDLGIDIGIIAQRPAALSGLADLLIKRSAPTNAASRKKLNPEGA